MNSVNKIKFLIFFSTALLSFFIIPSAYAKNPKPKIRHKNVAVRYLSQSVPDPIEIESGGTKTIIIKFKNTGTETLYSLNQHPNGYRHVSAYTMNPRYRKSKLRGNNWISGSQTASIAKDAKPGEIAELKIELSAPQKTGEYNEEFHLAAENYTWVKGGYFFLKIRVTPHRKAREHTNGDKSPNNEKPLHKAHKFIQSKKQAKAKGGERIKLIIGFQNVGDTVWQNYALISNQPAELASTGAELSFADQKWKDRRVILQKEKKIKSGEFFREEIYFRAPAKKGVYTARFNLHIDGEQVDGAFAEIPVTVTSNAPSYYRAPKHSLTPQPNFRLNSEPRIRVGLYRPGTFVQFLSAEAAYNVYSGTKKIGTLPKNKLGVLKFKDGKYLFKGGGINIASDKYIRLSPINNPHAKFILWNYKRYVKWKSAKNFNKYRGALEYRRGEINPDLWIINDLLLEDYVQGIGENGNTSPIEYLKAQTVAQRSYAYATIKNDKYGIFDVVATTGDQLYLGTENEKIMPNFVAAAKATRGQMVTYNNEIVITPYFARANCRTLSWTERWGGKEKPWLVPVKTNYDCARGLSRLGHGVGMSQIDASIRAKKEKMNWRDLVKYYYSGVKIEQIYE